MVGRIMSRTLFVLLSLVALALLPGCPPEPPADDDDTPEPCDNDGPEILLQAIEDGQPAGLSVQVVAQVTDPEGVSTVSLYYMTEGSVDFTFTFMSNEGTGDPNVYVAEVPASLVDSHAVLYYVRATDRVGDGCQAESFFPEGGEDDPARFSVALDQQMLPFLERFDSVGDCSTEEAELDDLGWAVSIQSFPQALHAWRLEDRSPLSGSCSASHGEGIPGGFWDCPPPDGDGTIERQNWLISPPLNFAEKTDIAVRWFEKHVTAEVCPELHQLYVSVGSPDPVAGDYQLVEGELPFPGSAWTSSAWYDLSQFAGNDEVYVALYYQGGAAGRWQIDDLYVGEPLADLALAVTPSLDPSAAPGSTNVELSISLENQSDTYSSPALTATLTSADPGLSVTAAGGSFGAMAPGETVAGDNLFYFDIAATHPNNAYLDFALELADGEGHSWTVPVRLLLGQESDFQLDYSTASPDQVLRFELGYGPQVAPDYSVSSDSVSLAGAAWTLNVTDHAPRLPPAAGTKRWFLNLTNEGQDVATVDGLSFVVGGVTYSAEPSDVPTTLMPESALTIELPPPPVLTLESYSVNPDPAAPGGTVTLSDVTLRNDGLSTQGPLGCVLGSSDPDLSGFSTSPVTFGGTPLAAGESRAGDGSFSFDIAASHTDNSPVGLVLLCTDGADTLTPSFSLPVPYAFPTTAALRVDDSATGDDDELADPGEQVSVFLTASNSGAFDTVGPLTATYSAGTGSTASFVLGSGGPLTFGSAPLAPGASVEAAEAIELSIDASALMGDTIVLDLVFEAGSDTWLETVTLDVTGLPWIDCPETPDAIGDNVSGSPFDIAGCAFRSDGTLLQVRLDSYTTFNPAQAFVDFFFYEVPSLYSIESVGGNATLEDGCVFGNDITGLTVPVSVDVRTGTSATARLAIADLGILANNTQVAFGAGSCPDIYFCDYYPDSSLMFNIQNGSYNCDGNSFIPLNW